MRGGYEYEVFSLPRFVPLRGIDGADPISGVILALYVLLVGQLSRWIPVNVAVVRKRYRQMGSGKVVHKERMVAGPNVAVRVSQLAEAVARGHFEDDGNS